MVKSFKYFLFIESEDRLTALIYLLDDLMDYWQIILVSSFLCLIHLQDCQLQYCKYPQMKKYGVPFLQ